MKQLNYIYQNYILRTKYIYWVYIVVSAISALSKYLGGKDRYNNYLLFKNVFHNTWLERNLYALYPDLYFDSNHYGIFFSVLIAPFAILPDGLGIVLWNIANTLVFLFAIHQLPFSEGKKAIFAWLCLQEFITASVSMQFNIALTGLIILSALFIYTKKETASAFTILIGFFVKIYGIAGLSSFFFIKNKTKFIYSFFLLFFLFLLLPSIISSPQFVIQSYQDWYASILEKNMSNQVLGSRQDYSIMGIVRRVVGDPTISSIYFLVPGVILFLTPYLRIKQYQNTAFRLLILASTLLFVVLFSTGSESPTYIIAVSGVVLWFLLQKKVTKFTIFLFLFVIILTCFGFSDLFPKSFKEQYIVKYSLKALPCVLVWFRVIYELLFHDFDDISTFEKNKI